MKLLAIIVWEGSARTCLNAASALARILDAGEIEALNVEVDPSSIRAAPEEAAFQRHRALSEGTAAARTHAAHDAFLAWMADHAGNDVNMHWTMLVATERRGLLARARGADLLVAVLARDTNMDGADAIHAASFSSGKPLLLVPLDWRPRGREFDHIVVALGESQVARDAIAGAAPLLMRARQVTALRIGAMDASVDALIGQIRALGVEPVLCVHQQDGQELGAQIVSESRSLDADLLVAGAYRYPAVIEWLLGGTTRHLLHAANLPVLLAH